MAAAETLCEIAADPSNRSSMIKLMKKPSRKTLKASKLKLNEKSQRPFVAPKSAARPDDRLLKIADNGILPSKKPRLSMQEKTKGVVCHTNPPLKGSTDWSSSRSIRSSQSKVFKDPVPESKNRHTNTVKKPYMMMPPPSRVIDKTFSNQQKPKKIVPME